MKYLVALGFLLIILLNACSSAPEREALFATVASLPQSEDAPEKITLEPGVYTRPSATAPSEAGADGLSNLTGETPEIPAVVLPTTAAIMDYRIEDARAYLTGLSDSGQMMGSVMIVMDGIPLLEEGYGFADIAQNRPNSPTTKLRIGSLSKQFTAAAIMRLQEQGKLNVQDSVDRYLPDYPGGERITLHQLLTHTAGIPNYKQRQDLAQVVQSPISLDELIATFSERPLQFTPGQAYAYSDSGYVILTKIVEVVSGSTYADFLDIQFFQPLGMLDTGYDFLQVDPAERATGYMLTPSGPRPMFDTQSSWASGAGALYSTIEDLYRWNRALDEGKVLQTASMAEMFRPWVDTGQGFSYGYGWEIGEMQGRPVQMHAGSIFGFASFVLRFPEERGFIVILSNGLQLSPRLVAQEIASYLLD